MAVVYSKVLLFDPPLIYTAPDTRIFGAVLGNMYFMPLDSFGIYLTSNFVEIVENLLKNVF